METQQQKTDLVGGDVHRRGRSLVGRRPESRLTGVFRRIMHTLVGAKPGTVRELKANEVVNCVVRLAKNVLRPEKRDRDVSEQEYSLAAGYSVLKLHKLEIPQYSYRENVLTLGSIRDVAQLGYAERNELLSQLQFESVLEVGAGELTSLHAIAEHFGNEKRYFGFDISLNRILHGLSFARSKGIEITTCQADGSRIPFPDHSFDLVFSSHSLEQMPRIYRETIHEMLRVSRKHVVLFEPSYEGASFLQKLHTRSLDYVRGIGPFLETLPNVKAHAPYLMRNSINPFNRGTMFRVEKLNAGPPRDPEFVCPVSRGALQQLPDGYYAPESRLFYPVVRGIPVLYKKYAQVVSAEHAQ